MAQFPEAIYLPGPDEPAGVLTWGKSPEQAKSDQAAVIARIGGFRSPDYAQSYLLAANTLLRAAQSNNRLDHHGIPIFFLQRHAAELMIKAPLQLGIEVQSYQKKLGHPTSSVFPTEDHIRHSERSHDLRELLEDLVEMSRALQLGIVPAPLHLVVEEILALEKEHTWSRYSFHFEGKKDLKTRHRHLQEEITIPLGNIQNQLQAASFSLGSSWPFDSSLMEILGSRIERLWREAGEIA